jgi:hypothetical protein
MAVTLNASTSAGFIQTADTTGVISLQNNGTTGLSLTSGNLQFNSGYGSVATAYGCRAWVNFNGTGTVAIRASGNVTSITDNGTGDYTVNFTTAMSDANYSVSTVAMLNAANSTNNAAFATIFGSATYGNAYTTTSIRLLTQDYVSIVKDALAINVAIFR